MFSLPSPVTAEQGQQDRAAYPRKLSSGDLPAGCLCVLSLGLRARANPAAARPSTPMIIPTRPSVIAVLALFCAACTCANDALVSGA
jgi:hypothetical protein